MATDRLLKKWRVRYLNADNLKITSGNHSCLVWYFLRVECALVLRWPRVFTAFMQPVVGILRISYEGIALCVP